MRIAPAALLLALLHPLATPAQEPPAPSYAGSWPAALTASRTGAFEHAGETYASSSSLAVRWLRPLKPIAFYVLVALEQRGVLQVETSAAETQYLFDNLKAGTEYVIYLRACVDWDCAEYIEAEEPAALSTEEEYWRIQGSGISFQTADRIVDDGNVAPYPLRYGGWAGPELAGKVQLYYVPQLGHEKGVKLGEIIAPSADSIESASRFRGLPSYGLRRVCQPAPATPGGPPVQDPACAASRSLATAIALFQAVPLPPEAGGVVRLYFEAQGFDGRTRILYLDSQDGYWGRDFHPGQPTQCATLDDFSPGGPCEPQMAVGVDVDGERGNPVLRHARQFKIGYPVLDSWVWNMKPGAFMWFTTEWPDRRCSPFQMNAAYAVWDGWRWQVRYGEDGCPKMLTGVQAPFPVHLGGGRYKMYFNRHFEPALPGPGTPPRKPMQMIYAGPASADHSPQPAFEDWEPLASARNVHYLWPGGGSLTEAEESFLDDHAFFSPTGDPKVLLMFTNMPAGGMGAPFIGSAVLVNP